MKLTWWETIAIGEAITVLSAVLGSSKLAPKQKEDLQVAIEDIRKVVADFAGA